MGYKHIDNLYKHPEFLEQYKNQQVYALEKIHGTSAKVSFVKGNLHFHPGGEQYTRFLDAFNVELLEQAIRQKCAGCDVVFCGEAYGGPQQGMSATYGRLTRFVVFEVKVDNAWQPVSEAEAWSRCVGLEFVHYELGPCDIDWLNAQRDAPSVQAQRNGIAGDKLREGIVIRTDAHVGLLLKHKGAKFCETASRRETRFTDLAVLNKADEIAEEWAVPERLRHVEDRLLQERDVKELCKADIGPFTKLLLEDIEREAESQITLDQGERTALRKRLGHLVFRYIAK